jgi:hypothetical protein
MMIRETDSNFSIATRVTDLTSIVAKRQAMEKPNTDKITPGRSGIPPEEWGTMI